MANLIAGSLNGEFKNFCHDRLEILSLLINNACNLSCKHCYLQAPKYDDYLDYTEWMRFLSNVLADIQPSVLSFSGKEVFINDESVKILLETVRLRNEIQGENGRTKIGVTTNGTLLGKYKSQLQKTSPDYWDVSIDGLPEEHNSIRGIDCFNQLKPNLKWLTQNSKPVWLTHTITKSNLETLPEFVAFYNTEFNVQNFALGFYKSMSYTDQALNVSPEDIYNFTDNIISSLQNLSLNGQTQVQVEVDFTQEHLLSSLTTAGWANPLDSAGTLLHTFENGLSLEINTVRDPQGMWRAARITPEGYWLAAKDLMKVNEYNQNLIARVRDWNYDANRMNEYYDECLHNLEIFEQKVMYG